MSTKPTQPTEHIRGTPEEEEFVRRVRRILEDARVPADLFFAQDSGPKFCIYDEPVGALSAEVEREIQGMVAAAKIPGATLAGALPIAVRLLKEAHRRRGPAALAPAGDCAQDPPAVDGPW